MEVPLAKALDRGRDRWTDSEYLTRIIFCDMVRDDMDSTTGYGIGLSRHGDVWRVLRVNCDEKSVYDEKWGYDGKKPELSHVYTFEEFIKDPPSLEE